VTLEEKKQKLREQLGYPDDHPIYTEEEWLALKKAERTSAGRAALEGVSIEIAPGGGALAAMAGASKALAKIPVPKGRLAIPAGIAKGVGMLGSAVLGGIATREAQAKVEEAVRGKDDFEAKELQRRMLRKAHPVAYTAGEFAGGGLGGGVRPTSTTLKGAQEFIRTAGGIRGKMNQDVAAHALTNVGIGGGLGLAFEGARQYSEGEFSPGALATAGVGGALLTEPWGHGRKLLGVPARGVTKKLGEIEEAKTKLGYVYEHATPRQLRESKMPLSTTEKLPTEVAYLHWKAKQGHDPKARQVTIEQYVKLREKELLDELVKKEKVNTDGAKVKEFDLFGDEVTTTSTKTAKKEKGLTDPKITKAVKDKFESTQRKRLEKQAKDIIKRELEGLTHRDLMGSLRRVKSVTRESEALQYIKESGKTAEEARLELAAAVEKTLLPGVFESAKNLVAKRGVTLNIALNRMTIDALKSVAGYARTKQRDIILSIDDLTADLPYHEVAHVFVRDMVESSNERDSKLMKGWLTDLYSDDPRVARLRGHPKLQDRWIESVKKEVEEIFVTESSKRLAERIRTLPKGKFDQMRRWFSDVKRGMKVRYGKPAVNDILDYLGQRMEVDVSMLLDNDLHTRQGIPLEEYLTSSKLNSETQLDFGFKPDATHKGTLTVEGVTYESSASAYAIPKEIAELFGIPDMPKGFVKQYVDNMNKMKSFTVSNKKFGSELEYLEPTHLMENSTDYPADFKKLMKIMQSRNTGAIKQVFKVLEDMEAPDIVLQTRRPEDPIASYNSKEITIGVPTIDDSFDMVLAQQLIHRRLMNEPILTDELSGVLKRMRNAEHWFNVYEPYMVESFLDFAIRRDSRVSDASKATVGNYHKGLDVENVDLRGTHGHSDLTNANFAKYKPRMQNQGNALHDVMNNLPDDVRLAFATRMVAKDNIWSSPEEFLSHYDAMLNLLGLEGSTIRNNFNGLSGSEQTILNGMLNKRTFSALDSLNVLDDKVRVSGHRNPLGPEGLRYGLDELWEGEKIPYGESAFGQKSAVDALTQKAEEVLGIKGLKPILERVIDLPVLPKTDTQINSSEAIRTMTKISGESTVMMVNDDTPIPHDATPRGMQQSITDRTHKIKYGTLKDFKITEPLTWKPFQRLTRSFRPVIDRIKEIGLTPEAKELAIEVSKQARATLGEHSKLMGRFLESLMLALSEVKMSPAEFNLLGDYQHARWRKHLGLEDLADADTIKARNDAYNTNARIRYFDRMMENIYRDTRQYQNDIGMKVEVFRGNESFLTPGKFTREYTPEIISQVVRRVMMKGETASPEYQKLRNEAIEYWESQSKNLTPEELEQSLLGLEEGSDVPTAEIISDIEKLFKERDRLGLLFDKMASSLKMKEQRIGSQRYKALRVATGKMGIPPHWVEQNAIQRLTRYVVRFSKDAAFFKHIESNDRMRKILGIPDQEGNYLRPDLPGLEKGGPFNLKVNNAGDIVKPDKSIKPYNRPVQSNHEVLDTLMQGYIGYYESWDLWTRTFNRMVTSSWLGVGAGLRDLASSYLFDLPYMRTQDLHILVTHLFKFRDAWVKSYLTGVNKTSLGNLEFTHQSASEISDNINKVADVALVVGGRSVLEKSTRALQFALGRQLISANLRMRPLDKILPKGDWTANRLLRNLMEHMGETTVAGRKVSLFDYVGKKNSDIPEELLDNAAAAWVEMNQGTYDVRGLPTFTQRGVSSMFTSLARWSIEKSDRMLKDVWMPLRTEGDPLPLFKATLGALLGGEAIKYLSEELANKVRSEPKLLEAIQMDNAEEQAYAVLSSLQMAGYFGFQSALLHDLYRSSRFGVSEGIPGGFTFPMADAATTIFKDFVHLLSSEEAFSSGWSAAWMKFLRNTIMGLNQTLRYSFQHLTLSDEMSEFNARTQLRKFRRLETGLDRPGVPSGISNEYAWPARRAFKEANSVSEARRLLPAAVAEAARKAIQKRPNNKREQSEQFDDNWKELYNLMWTATPALPNKKDVSDQIERMRYLGIKASASDLINFPMLAKETTRKPGIAGLKLGVKTVSDIPGAPEEMLPGTIISKKQSKRLMELEKEFLRLKQIKKSMILRYMQSNGKVI